MGLAAAELAEHSGRGGRASEPPGSEQGDSSTTRKMDDADEVDEHQGGCQQVSTGAPVMRVFMSALPRHNGEGSRVRRNRE